MPWKTPKAVRMEESPSAAVLGRATGDELGLARHEVHVLDVGAHVAGGDVAAAQRLDEAAVGAEHRLVLVLVRVADDDGLAAAEVEAGERVLVGHAAGEVERVLQRRLLRGVGEEPGPAEGRAEGGGVDGDDRLQSGGAVVAQHDLLVAVAGGAVLGVAEDPAEHAGCGVRGGGGLYVGHCGDSSIRGPLRWCGRLGRSVVARAAPVGPLGEARYRCPDTGTAGPPSARSRTSGASANGPPQDRSDRPLPGGGGCVGRCGT